MSKQSLRNSHLPTLRDNRERRFVSSVKPSLEKAGIDAGIFQPRFFQDISLIQNRTRGRVFELMAEVLLAGHLQRMGLDGRAFEKQVRFEIDGKIRIADFYVPAKRMIVEVKSGYVIWNRSVREQVAKDVGLMKQSKQVADVMWLLFRGGSARALASMEKAGITCYDLGFGVPQAESDSGPKTIIRV